MKYYSPSTRGFYDPGLHGPRFIQVPDPDYTGEGDPPLIQMLNPETNIPEDATEITDEMHAELLDSQRTGLEIEPDPATGLPRSVARTFTVEGMREAVFKSARNDRKKVLDALVGIGFRAMATNQPTILQSTLTLTQQLLDITKEPSVLAVTVEEGPEVLRQTVLARYREYAAQAPSAVRAAFKEIDL